MSQMANVVDYFLELKRENNWSEETTVNNFVALCGCIEWDLVYPPPRKEDNSIDWFELEQREEVEAKKLLRFYNGD